MRRRRTCSVLLAAVAFASPASAQWTQWGGPNQDFEALSFDWAGAWGTSGPRRLWSRKLGEGFSSILLSDNRLYTMRRHQDEESVVCLDATTGSTTWEYAYGVKPVPGHVPLFRNGEGPHATPLIVGDRIYSVGISGTLTCLDKKKGTLFWKRALWGELGGTTLKYGYSASPIAYQNMVIVTVGGQGLVALDGITGRVRWRTHGFEVSYSTPRLIEVDGRPHLVAVLAVEVVGVNPENGTVDWHQPLGPHEQESIAPPLWDATNQLLFVSVPTAGAQCFRIHSEGTKVESTRVWTNRKVQFFYGIPTLADGMVYGVSGVSSPSRFVGVDIKTGKIAWRVHSKASATCIQADGHLILLFEDGRLCLASATPAGLSFISETQLFKDTSNAWTVPTIVGQTLYARNSHMIVALDLH